MLPPLPVLLIFATLPTFNLFPALLVRYPAGLPVPHAMLVCTALLLLLYGRDLSSQTRTFFDGMGFAYVQVISLIMTAAEFIAGLSAYPDPPHVEDRAGERGEARVARRVESVVYRLEREGAYELPARSSIPSPR